jgi:hypothetical protein
MMMLKESKETHGKPTNNERVVAHAGAKELRMKNPAEEYVTLVEVLELTVPYEVRELVSVNFYAEPGSVEAGAILVFSDRERMLDHMRMISSWEEFGRFFAAVKPLDVRIYGRPSAEAEAWMGQFGDIVSTKFEHHTAGFVR